MGEFQEKLRHLVITLHEIDALKFGDFKMKVGVNSPVYFDLRVIVSYPHIMDMLSKLLWDFCKPKLDCQHLCGVPYTALPIASLMSVRSNIPMLIRRKEAKDYGTRKLIEGKYNKGDKCIIIEDVVTSGSSILETFRDLKKEGLEVTESVVVVDREQGGTQNLEDYGLRMRSLCTLSGVMEILHEAGRVDQETVDQVKNYVTSTQVTLKNYLSTSAEPEGRMMNRLTMSFSKRANEAKNPVAAQLLHLMSKKCTNLCLAADKTNSSQILEMATTLGPYICLLKLHADIIKDFSKDFVKKLTHIAQEQNFLILEDRKFADIGHVVRLQYSEGIYHISSWADLVTVHPVPGDGILEGLQLTSASLPNSPKRGCFLVMEMSSKGNLNSPQYIEAAKEMCQRFSHFVCGTVCQTASLVTDPGLIQLTPGVQLTTGSDTMGQQYKSPEYVVLCLGADVAVVGRGITEASNLVEAAKEYREQLWAAYEKRIAD